MGFLPSRPSPGLDGICDESAGAMTLHDIHVQGHDPRLPTGLKRRYNVKGEVVVIFYIAITYGILRFRGYTAYVYIYAKKT